LADDTRYAYAVARIRGMETRLLDRQWIERLLSEDADGVLRVLSDSAFQEAVSGVERPEDVEPGLMRALAETLTTVSGLSPEPELTDLFRLRWDFRNLKSLTKASLLKLEDADLGLVDGVGTVSVAVLESAVQERDYVALPTVLAETAREAEETFRDRGELAGVDAIFDRAMWSHQLTTAAGHGDDFLLGYFKAEIDLLNVRTFVRHRESGAERDSLVRAFVPGGTLELSFFEGLLGEAMDALARALEYGPYQALAQVLREWSRDRAYVLELACDNALLARVEHARTVAYGVEPLVAYILMREIEIKLVRAAVVSKLDGVERGELEERLRSLHV
jgi:V/A-type H+-transporting ATPase subunit C